MTGAVRTIAARELQGYFATPLAYVFIVIFLALTGLFTFYLGGFYERGQADLAPFFNFHPWLYLFLVPAIAMRLWAEERRSGTIELLLTLPISMVGAVVGKFLAAWIFYLLMMLLTAANPILFYFYHPFDIAPLLSAYLGMLLLGTAFIACGLFISSLTENQVLAAMGTYGVLIFFWFVTWNEEAGNKWVIGALLRLSLFDRFFNFSRGVIDTKDIAFFLLFTGLFLFLTLQSLNARKWRGVS